MKEIWRKWKASQNETSAGGRVAAHDDQTGSSRGEFGRVAPDGPERCSGLPVARYDAQSLGRALGDAFELVETLRQEHKTPCGSEQRFQFSLFRRASIRRER